MFVMVMLTLPFASMLLKMHLNPLSKAQSFLNMLVDFT